jgi:hypothetical protein
MPLFRTTIHKNGYGKNWSNVYHLDVADLAAAKTASDSIVAIERAVHKTSVSFNYYVTSEMAHPFTNYKHIYIGTLGTQVPAEGAEPLPLWNVVRVEFNTVVSGKPDVKNLRLPIFSNEITADGYINATLAARVDAYFSAAIESLAGIVSKHDHPYTGFSTLTLIHDRDLNKRRHHHV